MDECDSNLKVLITVYAYIHTCHIHTYYMLLYDQKLAVNSAKIQLLRQILLKLTL